MAMALTAFVFVGFVGLLSFVSLVYYYLTKADKSPSNFQQRLAAGMFSLVVTSMMMGVGIAMFARPFTQPPRQEAQEPAAGEQGSPPRDGRPDNVTGRFGNVTFTLYGAPAIWLIVFLFTVQYFKKKQPLEREMPKALPARSQAQ